MQTKLTLRLNKKSIILAKSYAKKTHQSISKIVEDYFVGLATANKSTPLPSHLPPLVSTLRGCLSGTHLSKEDYKKYLEEKYQ